MCRLRSASLALLVSILATSVAFAQGRFAQPVVTEIQVRVSYGNEQRVGQQVQIDLLNGQGIPVGQTFTDSEGQAVFHITGGGVYRARASGADIEQTVSDAVNVESTDRIALIWMHVKQKAGADNSTNASSPNTTRATTTANELRIPADAKKSFMKGMDALYRHDYQKAIEQFEKATAAYPQYDAAYDNLGVTYMQLGQTGKARDAFERAVQLNDKNADAERNYARLLITGQEYVRAIELLNKALIIGPQDPASLTLIAIAQLRTGDLDAALQNALKVHQLQHEGYALAHYVAGRAYEVKQQYPKATAEYEAYLRESPNGPEARQVHAALARVTASASTAPQSGTTPQ
jgi:Flp pilus assembly protein TadD